MSLKTTTTDYKYNNDSNCKINSTVKRVLKSVSDVLKLNSPNKTVSTGVINKLMFACQKVDNFNITTEYLTNLSKKLYLLEKMYGMKFKMAFCSLEDMKNKMKYAPLSEMVDAQPNDVLVWVCTWNNGLKTEEDEMKENGLL